jgi:GNAT superfamily N-acetyltransferase
MGIEVRPVRAADASALAAHWIEAGEEYARIDPSAFRVPDKVGLIERLERSIARERGDDEVWLVAELDGEVGGTASGRVVRPAEDAGFELVRNAGRARLVVEALIVGAEHRRRGVGRALMAAVESWGRWRGAKVALLDTYARSPMSVPFYETLGYERRQIVFEKRLY